jgi:CspA family cold shock protein
VTGVVEKVQVPWFGDSRRQDRPGTSRKGRVHVPTGTVKWFNDEKGYGFITPDDGDRDLFVHYTGIDGGGFKSLAENTKVEYEEEAGDKGPKAVNVRAI